LTKEETRETEEGEGGAGEEAVEEEEEEEEVFSDSFLTRETDKCLTSSS
jgi:hypothetical protein